MAEKIKTSRYKTLLNKVFQDRFRKGLTSVPFKRSDLEAAAKELGLVLPKNLGDIIYNLRYRSTHHDEILATQPEGMEWIISGRGDAQYAFELVPASRILPNEQLVKIKIPDATPEIISAYALSDEQALLAKVRYNRLVDIFLGISAYSLQNHLRTKIPDIGQIEIDEIYVGLDKHGRQFIVPVQAKGGSDKLAVTQTTQDLACCKSKFPDLICRPVSAQFISEDIIAMFELVVEDAQIRVAEERHYKLVPSSQISAEDVKLYRRSSS